MGFFDNLSKKATETYKNTTDKTNKMAREMKLKSYINENKNKIHGIYTEIGKKVYEKHKEGNVSEIEEFIKPELEQIEEVTRKIENMNNEIRTINNIKLCQNCAAEIDLSARFCPKCGVEQKNEEEATTEVAPINETETSIEETPISNQETELTNEIQPATAPEQTTEPEPVIEPEQSTELEETTEPEPQENTEPQENNDSSENN